MLLASCAPPNHGTVAPGASYGYGTNNGPGRQYRTDGKFVAANRSSYGGSDNYYNQYNRSPYGGGPTTRTYRGVHPSPIGYPGYGYPGYGYPAGRYGRW